MLGPLTMEAVIGFTQGANGSVTDQGGGVLRYAPNPPHVGPDQFMYQVMDNDSLNASASVNVGVVPPGGPPVIDLNGTHPVKNYGAMFFAGMGPVPIAAPAAVVFDPDGVVQFMQVTITNLLDGPAEFLNADVPGTAITPNYNPGTGMLQLDGPDSAAAFQQILRTVVYGNGNPASDMTDRVIVCAANDGTGNSIHAELRHHDQSVTP